MSLLPLALFLQEEFVPPVGVVIVVETLATFKALLSGPNLLSRGVYLSRPPHPHYFFFFFFSQSVVKGKIRGRGRYNSKGIASMIILYVKNEKKCLLLSQYKFQKEKLNKSLANGDPQKITRDQPNLK